MDFKGHASPPPIRLTIVSRDFIFADSDFFNMSLDYLLLVFQAFLFWSLINLKISLETFFIALQKINYYIDYL